MKLTNIILASLILSAALCSCSNSKDGEIPTTTAKVEKTAAITPKATKTADKTTTANTPDGISEKDYLSTGSDLLNNEYVGPLNLNLNSDDFIKALGEPESKSDAHVWGADGREHQDWTYAAKGISINTVKNGNVNNVFSIHISSPCTFKTSRGIGIGSKKADVIEAYKNEIDPIENKDDSDSIVAGSVYDGIIFTIKNDSVSKMFFGAAAE